MAQASRWTLKILALPIFSDEFAQAILETPLADLAFVVAMDAGSGAAFADVVASWAPSWDESIGNALFTDPSSAVQLAFGQCEGVDGPKGSSQRRLQSKP